MRRLLHRARRGSRLRLSTAAWTFGAVLIVCELALAEMAGEEPLRGLDVAVVLFLSAGAVWILASVFRAPRRAQDEGIAVRLARHAHPVARAAVPGHRPRQARTAIAGSGLARRERRIGARRRRR